MHPTSMIKQPTKFLHSWNINKWGLLLACLFFLIPLCSLPPTRIGYFGPTETCLMAFWFLSGMSGLWIYFLGKKKPHLPPHVLKLPIVWGPILLGMVTILLAPFHPLPLRDFVGSAQLSEGALTFIASGIMAAHFSILTRVPAYRRVIVTLAILTGLVICTLTIIGCSETPFPSWRYWKWAPFFFPDFLAFIDIALLACYAYMRKDTAAFKPFYDTLALIIFMGVGYYASNKSLTYGVVIASASAFGIWLFPKDWRRNLLQLAFFGLSFSLTLFIIFYDDISKALPESLNSFGHMSTLISRTWLSKIALIDLWYDPLNWAWIKKIVMGNGWGTFSNLSASNMFLIDQISLFSGKEYQPNWELLDRDLLHTHNILTNIFHSLGLFGVSLYVYAQYHLIKSLPQNMIFIGTLFLIAYQTQVLLWFQFVMVIPFILLTFSLVFKGRTSTPISFVSKPHFTLGFTGLLILFSCLQGWISIGYRNGLLAGPIPSNTILVDKLTSAPYVRLEALFGGQRQIALARAYTLNLQKEFEKSPEKQLASSLKVVHYFKSLPKDGNYLANNLALNILNELASHTEIFPLLSQDTFTLWEQLAQDHIEIMPYRSDILLPFFNLYQTLGKEAVVLDFTKKICDKNPRDPIALWFIGSSLLKSPAQFDNGMCTLQESIRQGVERFMPLPPSLKTKIMLQAKTCPQGALYVTQRGG